MNQADIRVSKVYSMFGWVDREISDMNRDPNRQDCIVSLSDKKGLASTCIYSNIAEGGPPLKKFIKHVDQSYLSASDREIPLLSGILYFTPNVLG